MTKSTCGEMCRRELTSRIHKARYSNNPESYSHYKVETDRSKKCMNKTHICSNFSNWMKEPDLHCKCSGFDPVLKPTINPDLSSTTGGRQVGSGMVARKGGCE